MMRMLTAAATAAPATAAAVPGRGSQITIQFTWPTVVFAVLLAVLILLTVVLIIYPQLARQFFRALRIRTLKIGLIKIDVGQLADQAKTIQGGVDEAFRSYRSIARQEFEYLARRFRIEERLDPVVREAKRYQTVDSALQEHRPKSGVNQDAGNTPSSDNRSSADIGLRVTVHVLDLLFDEMLYQLVDYYPAGGGSGRTISIRFGNVGLAWRRSFGDVITPAVIRGNYPTDSASQVEKGATYQDTERGKDRHSFAAVVIREAKLPVAVLSFDAYYQNVFGTDLDDQFDGTYAVGSFPQKIEQAALDSGLTGALLELEHEARKARIGIKIYDRN